MFRFTIRDVLWLTVVVGVLCAWWLDRDGIWRTGDQNRQMVDRFKKVNIEPKELLEALESTAPPSGKVVRIKVRGKDFPPMLNTKPLAPAAPSKLRFPFDIERGSAAPITPMIRELP